MNYERKAGTGALFRKEKKREGMPDFRGPFYDTVGGEIVEREIAAWARTSKRGEAYFSVQVKDKFVPNSNTNAPNREQPPAQERSFDDDVPF